MTKKFHLVLCSTLFMFGAGCLLQPARAWEAERSVKLTAAAGKEMKVREFSFMGRDCRPEGLPVVRFISLPAHGATRAMEVKSYPSYSKENPRYVCNTKIAPHMKVTYRSKLGYLGEDRMSFEVIWPNGNYSHYDVFIKVR